VVVDNGSNDATGSVVEKWQRRDSRIRGVEEPDVGLSRAKNAGIRNARGRLILFTDDDVIVASGWIAAYVDFFSRCRSRKVLAGGPVLPLPDDLSLWPPWIHDGARPDLPSLYYGERERLLRESEWVWGANMAVPRTLLEELGTFHDELGRGARDHTYEDVELADRVRMAGGEVWYCATAAVHHRVPPDSARPRQLVMTAFTRGGNDRIATIHGNYVERACRVPASRLAAGLTLPWALVALMSAAAASRLTRRPWAFDRARQSAWCAGWCMWALLGASSKEWARVARWGVLRVRDAALRLMPV